MRCCGDKGWGGEGQVTCGQRCGCDAEMSCGRLEMEDGRWKIEDGRQKVEDAGWMMEDGRWKMEYERWKMCHRLKIEE